MGFAETFKALSDPARREILVLLKQGQLSAGEIGSHFDMTGATISYHLNVLKKAELVHESKYKNFVYYQLNTTVVEEIMLWFSDLKGENEDDQKKQDDHYPYKRHNPDPFAGGSGAVEPAAGHHGDAF